LIELTGLDRNVKLTAGEHGLVVSGPDFETITRSFNVRQGDRQIVAVSLEPKRSVAGAATPDHGRQKGHAMANRRRNEAEKVPAEFDKEGRGLDQPDPAAPLPRNRWIPLDIAKIIINGRGRVENGTLILNPGPERGTGAGWWRESRLQGKDMIIRAQVKLPSW